MKSQMKSILVAIALLLQQATPADAYQIDCAILLCLAGGFPPSAPCAAAKAEIIRRITPWPIQPPLQLWRCPMQAGFGIGAEMQKQTPVAISYDEILPARTSRGWPATPIIPIYDAQIESYLAAIKVYDLTYQRHSGHDGECKVSARLQIGSYDALGNFAWHRASARLSPPWLFDTQYSQCSWAYFRGVGLRWQDYQGVESREVVRY